jgi:hypothetical protein
MATRPDLAGLLADLASSGVELTSENLTKIDLAFDGHPVRNFAEMDAQERLDDLSRKIALVLELRKSRVESQEKIRKDS